jgi:hypothetical protein
VANSFDLSVPFHAGVALSVVHDQRESCVLYGAVIKLPVEFSKVKTDSYLVAVQLYEKTCW